MRLIRIVALGAFLGLIVGGVARCSDSRHNYDPPPLSPTQLNTPCAQIAGC